jgi:dihydrofolate reductase
MSKVILNLTMSLDGYIAGPNVRPEEPMGDGGEELHNWMFNSENPDDEAELFKNAGAVIIGGRTFELGVEHWGEDPAFHAPCFVLSEHPRETITKQGGTSYTFVTDGVESALAQAHAVAGDKDIVIMGGANAAQQYINAGLVDELHIHLAHMLLGDGTRLFDQLTIQPTNLEKIAVADASGVTHLKLRIRK